MFDITFTSGSWKAQWTEGDDVEIAILFGIPSERLHLSVMVCVRWVVTEHRHNWKYV